MAKRLPCSGIRKNSDRLAQRSPFTQASPRYAQQGRQRMPTDMRSGFLAKSTTRIHPSGIRRIYWLAQRSPSTQASSRYAQQGRRNLRRRTSGLDSGEIHYERRRRGGIRYAGGLGWRGSRTRVHRMPDRMKAGHTRKLTRKPNVSSCPFRPKTKPGVWQGRRLIHTDNRRAPPARSSSS